MQQEIDEHPEFPIAPGALKTQKPNGVEILLIVEFLAQYRKFYEFTQRQAACALNISYRRVQTFEAASRWSESNKEKVRNHPGLFDFTATTRLARRSWSNQRSLSKEIDRIIASEPERKRYTRSTKRPDSCDLRSEERLRERFGTKVLITEDSIVLLHFGNSEIKEMLLEKLLR